METNFGGWWFVEVRPSAGVEPWRDAGFAQAAERNGNWWSSGSEFVRSGSSLTAQLPDTTSIDRREFVLTIVNDNEIEGTRTTYSAMAPVVEDLRLTRTTAPTGTLTATGWIESESVNVTSSSAFARYEQGTDTVDVWIEHSEPFQGGTAFQVNTNETVEPGTYQIGWSNVPFSRLGMTVPSTWFDAALWHEDLWPRRLEARSRSRQSDPLASPEATT